MQQVDVVFVSDMHLNVYSTIFPEQHDSEMQMIDDS